MSRQKEMEPEGGDTPSKDPLSGDLKTSRQIVEERMRRMKADAQERAPEPPPKQAGEPPAPQTPQPAAPASAPGAPPAPAPESAALQALRDRLAHALADYDNLQKRVSRERAELRQGIVVHLARDLLPVLDGFDRALGSVPPGAEALGAEALAEGMRRVQAQLRRAVEAHGVLAIETSGEPFDPTLHESVAQESRDGVEAGRILEILERGYRIGDLVLRPAKVRVSAPPPAGV